MNTVGCWSGREDRYVAYSLPSFEDAAAHLKATHGRQYDPIERKTVEGGEPMLWQRVEMDEDGARRISCRVRK